VSDNAETSIGPIED